MTIRDSLLDCDTPLGDLASQYKLYKDEFYQILFGFLDTKTTLHTIILAKALACFLGNNDRYAIEKALKSESYKLPEVLRACQILDSRRSSAQIKKKLNGSRDKNGKLQCELNNLEKITDNYLEFSLTKSKSKMIKKYWISQIPADKLEFYVLSYDLSYWKILADLLHLKSSDFKLDWFLNYVYTLTAPIGSTVHACKSMTTDNSLEIISKYKPDYNFIRTIGIGLSNASKTIIASYTDINVLLWWFHEFIDSGDSIDVINTKTSEESIALPYGVLIDKLSLINKYGSKNSSTTLSNSFMTGWQVSRPTYAEAVKLKNPSLKQLYDKLLRVAEKQLIGYKLKFEGKVVIFGDASSSMDVAIKTSSIIMSILCAICNAEMHLFRTINEHIKNVPKNVNDVMKFNETCRASDMTSPAASLDYYYSRKEKVDVIIMVTDEEENTPSSGLLFKPMFDKYCETIGKIPKLIFISFLKKGNRGQMYPSLNESYPEYVHQYIFDKSIPDLTKLDSILTKLSELVV